MEEAAYEVCSAAREWVPVSPTYCKEQEFSIAKSYFEGKTTQEPVSGLGEQDDLQGTKQSARSLLSRGRASINTPTRLLKLEQRTWHPCYFEFLFFDAENLNLKSFGKFWTLLQRRAPFLVFKLSGHPHKTAPLEDSLGRALR